MSEYGTDSDYADDDDDYGYSDDEEIEEENVLSSLKDKTICEILSYISFSDLINFIQTCKNFREIGMKFENFEPHLNILTNSEGIKNSNEFLERKKKDFYNLRNSRITNTIFRITRKEENVDEEEFIKFTSADIDYKSKGYVFFAELKKMKKFKKWKKVFIKIQNNFLYTFHLKFSMQNLVLLQNTEAEEFYKDDNKIKKEKINLYLCDFYDVSNIDKKQFMLNVYPKEKNEKDEKDEKNKSQSFCISFKNFNSYQIFINDMIDFCFGNHCGSEVDKKGAVEDFEKIEILKWNFNHIKRIMKFIGFPKNFFKFFFGKYESVLNGEMLINSTKEEFSKVGKVPIGIFKSNNNFKKFWILKKIVGKYSKYNSFIRFRIFKIFKKLTKHVTDLNDIGYSRILQLSDETLFQSQFLNYLGNLKVFKYLKMSVRLILKEPNENKDLLNFKTTLKVDDLKPNSYRNKKIFIIPVVNIGNFYLEWSKNEFIIPKLFSDYKLGNCTVTYLTEADSKLPLHETLSKLTKLCCKYNSEYRYCEEKTSTTKDYEKNSQDFVDDIFAIFDVKTDDFFPPKFVENMRKNGKSELNIEFSETFRSYFKVPVKSKKFFNHQKLDSFSLEIKQRNIDVGSCFKSEWNLLQLFDRVFWFRHLCHPNVERYKPTKALPGSTTGCTFGDLNEDIEHKKKEKKKK